MEVGLWFGRDDVHVSPVDGVGSKVYTYRTRDLSVLDDGGRTTPPLVGVRMDK